MFFLIFCLFIFSFSSLYATTVLEDEGPLLKKEKTFINLLNRKDFLGDKNLRSEGAISLERFPDPLNEKTLFSGKEIDFQKEKEAIGEDKREIVAGSSSWTYPGACIASLEIRFEDFTNWGTGFLVAPNYVITAAHNLYDYDKTSRVNSIMCYFGRYKNYVKDYCEVEGFTLHESSKNRRYASYSLLLLKKAIGQKVGYLNPTLFDFREHLVFIQGYPARYYGTEKEEWVNNSCQYESESKEILVNKQKLYHHIQTTSGQSGSPILVMIEKEGGAYPCFIGIHMRGAENVDVRKKKSEEKEIERRYPYQGIYVTNDFLEDLMSLLTSLSSLPKSLQKKKEPYFLQDGVDFYPLSYQKDEKNGEETSVIILRSTSSSMDETSDIDLSLLEKGNSSFKEGNYQQAKKSFKEAEEKGLEASSELAKTYSKLGQSTADEKKAFKYYLKAAQKGKAAQDQLQVAERYFKGTGITKDYEEAFKWYQKAADQNHAEAQFLLGNCYYYGYGTKVNPGEAKKFYDLAEKNGYKAPYSICSVM